MECIDIMNLCKKSSSPTSSEHSNDLHKASNNSTGQQKRKKRVQKLRPVSERQHAINLYMKGLSKAEVSRQTNIPESTLRGWIKEAQIQDPSIHRQRSSSISDCSTHSDDDLSKSRLCDIQLPLKKRKIHPAMLEQLGYYGGTSTNSKRKRNSTASSKQTEIENIDPCINNNLVVDEAAVNEGLKAKKTRCMKQLDIKPELQTEEEKLEWLRQRQLDISMKMMESVMKEQKIHVDQNQIRTNLCTLQQRQQKCLKLASDKKDESEKVNDVPAIDEAIEHGERFQTWLENCSNPAVSMYKIQEFRKLMNSIIGSRKKLTS